MSGPLDHPTLPYGAYIKSRVYETPPNDLNDLRQRIIDEAELIKGDPTLVRRVVRDMVRRAQDCVAKNGGHVKDGH